MAKASVDKDKCISCGTCTGLCPDCFELGEDNKAQVKGEECEGCDLKEVVESCPVGAITIKN